MRKTLIIAVVVAMILVTWIGAHEFREQVFPDNIAVTSYGLPVCKIETGRVEVSYPRRQLAGMIGSFRNELFAYLMAGHYRSRPQLSRFSVYLTYAGNQKRPYRIFAVAPSDFLEGAGEAFYLEHTRVIPDSEWTLVADNTVDRYRRQSAFFEDAYNLPVQHALDHIPRSRLSRSMRQFLRFKSATDPRVLSRLGNAPEPLSPDAAGHLAADIIRVADFYSLPLDFFLGIGAMENNYMNVKGDIGHAIWKRKPAKDDIVLRKRAGKVLVLNESVGVWQITRETLRYAHELYIKDSRDYTELPERLRPPRRLVLDHLDAPVLTTYAGLLFRDLIDRFDGDVTKAVGAYNGGFGNPNQQYSDGVRRVADYARKMLAQGAALNGPVVEQAFIASAR